MCGIGGILRTFPAGTPALSPQDAISESWLDLIDDAITHRGPDGAGRFRDRVTRDDGASVDVVLIHRRMSILDLAGGGQPMISERGRDGRDEGLIAVVFNGCIYNHRDLRRELEAAGHSFKTDHSDTEVLIHGWREWRTGVLPRLEGMFALAIWDRARALLVLARDFAGEKPLYFARPLLDVGESMVFASAAGGVLAVAEKLAPDPARLQRLVVEANIDRLKGEGADPASGIEIVDATHSPPLDVPHKRVDLRHAELRHWQSVLARGFRGPREATTAAWLALGWSPHPPFRAVEELAPATIACSKNEGWIASGNRFLAPSMESKEIKRIEPLTVDSAQALLVQSVRQRLESDVPLGCFLSGGLDSGLVAAFANAELAKVGRRLRTFTVRMPSPDLDESAAAGLTAGHLGTEHTILECSPDPAQDMLALIRQIALPFGDSSLLPTYWLCRAAREHVKVALAGDGGDELFAGYDRYVAYGIIRGHRHALRLLPEGLTSFLVPSAKRERARRFLAACRYGYHELLQIFGSRDYRRLTGEPTRARSWHDERPMRVDFEGYLPFDLLRKTDSASMAVALEVRSPFLSRDLIRAALKTPQDVLMPGGERKGLLRQVARRYLPPEIVDRPKQGFAIPVGEWFRTDYGGMKTMLLDHLNSADPWPNIGIELNRGFVRQVLDEHMSTKRDHSQRLYMLLVLSIWAKAFLV